jgi:hypothetical protein
MARDPLDDQPPLVPPIHTEESPVDPAEFERLLEDLDRVAPDYEPPPNAPFRR